jgi:orotidine-5'-phosphate decarboxylase
MKKNEQCRLRVESKRIRDAKRQDICETVRNNRENVACFFMGIWMEPANNVTGASS